ncbi:hypothetical protein M3204_22920 [Mesobacillus subterraneus]|uniref:hypothetical protein n=1 Tax=Mesobacillus subterraneus TaxID=285983 RepID=UPI00203B41BE|nr:hypothetical protein [Mesobacillus subterraneus]MCM3667254.1 hypothetical protein [Mesobacillus subterraneus]MCM3686187.1 hypothetical protein [Mesobacillus subterraneus]
MTKRQTIIIVLVSFLLVTMTPMILPDTPSQVSPNAYKYEFGFPFHFIEQEVGIIVSHGTVETLEVSDVLFNPFEITPNLLIINYILSVLTFGIVIYIFYFVFRKITGGALK